VKKSIYILNHYTW